MRTIRCGYWSVQHYSSSLLPDPVCRGSNSACSQLSRCFRQQADIDFKAPKSRTSKHRRRDLAVLVRELESMSRPARETRESHLSTAPQYRFCLISTGSTSHENLEIDECSWRILWIQKVDWHPSGRHFRESNVRMQNDEMN